MVQIRTYPTLEAMRHLSEVCGKFVQLNWQGEPWLLFASKDQHAFHNQIVAHFLSDMHQPYHWRSPEVLTFEQRELEILGGGKFQLDWEARRLLLSDNSMVYGRFDEELLRQSLAQLAMPWQEFSIEIR